jgi:ATP-dependent Clp protease protease subunit
MSLAASVRVSPASSIRANRASLARSSSPLDDGIRLTERSTAFIIRLRHAQAAAARVAPRNGLSSRRRVATGTVALRAQPRSRTVARSAPYTPLKINAVRHLSRNLKLRSLCRSTPRSRTTACRFFSTTTTTTTTTRRLHRAEAARSRARNARVETRDDSSNDSSLARTDVDRRRRRKCLFRVRSEAPTTDAFGALDFCAFLARKQVIPSLQGDASTQSPPDLPSFIFKERIVYLGMTLVPSVTELILAELLYLQYEDNNKPIYLYINSTGTSKEGQKYGYDTEAFAIYDTMKYVNPPVHTVAVGTAWGEAAMLLACGEKGHRAALPSASIMIKQPINAFRGQATELEIQRKEIRNTKRQTLELLSKGIGRDYEEIEKDINRPKYFNPWEAVEYGIIDQVLDGKH